jgi:hypothetical protein
MKAQNERLSAENAKVLAVKAQIIKQPVHPVTQRLVRREREPHQERQPSSIDYLAQQSCAEQLQTRLRENML